MVARVSVLPSTIDKPRYVSEMFGRIAERYDLMNTLMTFGQDARWRRVVAEMVAAVNPKQVLDVGTGTGHLAEAVQRAAPGANVVGADFTLPMLRRARIAVVAADALVLPFADAQFDAVVSGFLVRNLADVASGVAEQTRVLKPGGVLLVLETTPGPTGVLRPLYQAYFRNMLPLAGGLIAGDSSAYTYLPESTLAFVEPTRVAQVLREAGLNSVKTRRLMFGCVAVTEGRKSQSDRR
jgi:demethylmenaquinone methyltransferase/2-methoxy-6-polyprenyl-1,4-benzoquinol methylase